MRKTRELVVVKKAYVTPNMLRVTLGGSDVTTLPKEQESAYVKLIFPTESGKLMRTYTIRHQRAEEIDIDFMLHDKAGPASTWAQEAQEGDTILIGGPGPRKMINMPTNYYLLVGDMTALPAISVNLAELPDNAVGNAIIEIVSEQDKQTLLHPAGINVQWVINPTPGQDKKALLEKVQALTWHASETAVWVACEFDSMKMLRAYFKEQGVLKEQFYISSYWKLGSNEEQHKVIKQLDAN